MPRPVQPNHRSREWLLAQNHYDRRIMVYAFASWNNDNPDDYLAAGWWLIYPPGTPFWKFEDATRGVFIDGPEIDPMNPPDLPIDGTAAYTGSSGGLYTYQYGGDWGEELKGTTEYTEFAGPLSLEADFSKKMNHGLHGMRCADPNGAGAASVPRSAMARTGPCCIARRIRCAFLSRVRHEWCVREQTGFRATPRTKYHCERWNMARAIIERTG